MWLGSNARALAGRLANRDDPLAAEDEVDLLVVDDVLLGHGDRGEQEAEHVVAVALDARAQAAAVGVCGPRQLGPRVGAQLVRNVLAQLLFVGVEQIGPGATSRFSEGSAGLG